MARLGILALMVGITPAPGCGGTSRPVSLAEEQLFQHEAIPIGFLLPADWQTTTVPTASGSALVFAGPSPTRGSYTPITLRLVPTNGTSLDEQVEQILTAAASHPHFRPWSRAPVVGAHQLGLAYSLELEHHESRQWQHGVVLPVGDLWLHLALSAVPDYFAEGIPVFERILATLVTANTTPGWPDSGND